jgi:hypothetical protein
VASCVDAIVVWFSVEMKKAEEAALAEFEAEKNGIEVCSRRNISLSRNIITCLLLINMVVRRTYM